MNKTFYIIIFIAVAFLTSSFSVGRRSPFVIKTVVIDPGHGGEDPGCHGAKYKEKDIALAVSLKLGKYIEEHIKDVRVVYTRKTDVFVDLQDRANIANKAKADLFISIHCNSACVRDKKLKKDICKEEIQGAETYIMGIKNEQGKLDIAKRENSAILLEDNYVQKYDGFDPNSDESYIIMSMFTDTYLAQSLSFSSKLQKQYRTKAGRVDKGVKRASLWVLWRTFMPSVLTEIGYLTNKEEEEFLGSVKGQEYIASGIFRAFREYKDEVEGITAKYDDEFETNAQNAVKKEDTVESNPKEKNEITVVKDTVKILKDSGIDKPLIVNENPDIKKDTEKLEKTKPAENKAIIYKVQIVSSDKKIPLHSERFKNVINPSEYIDKGVFKYTTGEFSNLKDAVKMQAEMRNMGFKDAFVIATSEGKRIPLK